MKINSSAGELTILIVDDNATNLGVIADYLEAYDFNIVTAVDGEDGLATAHEVLPNLILLDIMMPGIDGFEVCRRLQEDKRTQHIPIIFMTALANAEDKVRGLEAGAVDYVTKPINQEEVLARVRTHLTIQAQQERLTKMTVELKRTNQKLTQTNLHLQKANELLSKQAIQLQTSSQVGRQATAILELDDLLTEVVKLIAARFGYYMVSIWLLDESKEGLVLQASYGPGGSQVLEPGYSLALDANKGIVSSVARSSKYYATNNTAFDPYYLPLKELPGTRSELALPLRFGQETIGVLDIQSNRLNSFEEEDRTVLQTLADQIAVAIHNARLYAIEKNLSQMEAEKAQELAQLNASKDKFFSIVAHDLKGPFTPLLGATELLLATIEKKPLKDSKKLAQSIHRSAENVYHLLENLLHWSRMQRGQIEYNPALLELKEAVDNSLATLTEYAHTKQIELKNTIVQPIHVYADKNMLDVVIRNLISNALKFTPQGGQVTVEARPSLTDENLMEVLVMDTGIGITSEDQQKLFNIDQSHTTKGTSQEDGSGLGLIICQELIHKNKGQIWLESQPGQGTTVTFTLPLTE